MSDEINDPAIPSAVSKTEQLHEDIIAAIKTCYDPEIPVDIYELGLIYQVEVREANAVHVQMPYLAPQHIGSRN